MMLTTTIPDWYLVGSLRAMAEFIRREDPSDERVLQLWAAYTQTAPPPEEQ